LAARVAMKGRRYAILAAAILILIAGGVWLVRDQPGEQPGVTLAFATQPTNGGSGHATFRLYNDSTRAIFLSWMVVQTKTPIGWREVEKWEPKDPRVVYSAKSTDLVVAVPAQAGRWRLKIIYGTENRGPALLLTRAELGIKKRSLSGLGSVGVFTGQRAVAVEMAQ
jgi:hypothetical protein